MSDGNSRNPGILYITEEAVRDLLSWDFVYEATEAALLGVATGNAIQNARTNTRCHSSQTRLLCMPGFLNHDKFGALACKLVTANPDNADLLNPLPTINANIALFDEITGIFKAMVAGTEITKWRTAAASVVATKHLARKNPQILAILGAGVQGLIHAEAFNHFFEFAEIRIWNRNKTKAAKLVSELNRASSRPIFRYVESNEDCVKGADVVVTATFAEEAIVQLEWLKEGAHVNAVGCGSNYHSELSESIYRASDVYIDYREGADVELAGLLKMGIEFKGLVGDVIGGHASELGNKPITVFQSLGMAVEDCALARLIYDLYVKKQTNRL